MPDHPCLLSVVIPSYNRRGLVQRAVQSILNQTAWMCRVAPHIEVIVVDDGSTDGTTGALFGHYHDDTRVKLLRTERRYASGARNIGLAAAHGEFLCFLDSDDYWLPHTFDQIMAVFGRHPELAFVSVDGNTLATADNAGLARVVAGDSPGWSHAWFARAPLVWETIVLAHAPATGHVLRGDFFPAIINGDLFYLSGLLMRRGCAESAGPFNERFRYFNDWDFFARLCLQGPGAYLAVDGFRRDTGRDDQISRRRPVTAMPRRHLFILRALQRRVGAEPYAAMLRSALFDAYYRMARALARCAHHSRARRYALRCIDGRHKIARCLALLAGWR